MLLDPTGKMFLAEEYGKVIENVQKLTISGAMKNTELSGDLSCPRNSKQRDCKRNTEEELPEQLKLAAKATIVKSQHSNDSD